MHARLWSGGVVVTLAVVAFWVAQLVQQRKQSLFDNARHTAEFEQLQPGLYRLQLDWIMAGIANVSIAVYAVRVDKHDWILVDCGPVAEEGGFDVVPGAVQRLLGSTDRLRGVFVTHAHPEHLGGLHMLLPVHRDAAVIVHEGEAPVMLGQRPQFTKECDNWGWWAAHKFASLLLHVPPVAECSARLHIVHGKRGDLADAVSADASKTALGIPRGVLEYVHLPGHADGHAGLLHKPSQTLLMGDAVRYMGNAPILELPVAPWREETVASAQSAGRLAGWRQVYFHHDQGGPEGVPRAAYEDFVRNVSTGS